MTRYDLPESLTVAGREYSVRWDFRAAMDIFAALNDPDLGDQERAFVCLGIFYPDWQEIPPGDYQEAIKQCFWFLNGGQEEVRQDRKPLHLVDWEKDLPYIAAPVNRVLGKDCRGGPLHWWTFLAAYFEIGDCTFAQIVRIRNLKAKGKPLDKSDREWYRQNRDLVDLRQTYTQAEHDLLKEWGG